MIVSKKLRVNKMNLKKLFLSHKKAKYRVPNEFRLTDILSKEDININKKLQEDAYKTEWKNPPQSSLCFMAYPHTLNAGGLKTIIAQMEAMSAQWGVKNYICFYPRYKQSTKNLKQQNILSEEMHKAFPKLIFEIIPYSDNYDDYPEVDIAFCNWWLTAFPLAKFKKCRQKYYLIQDFEPYFSQAGSTFAVTEESYKFGFIGLANSSALARLYSSYGNKAVYRYQAGVDHKLYYPLLDKKYNKEKYKIVFYGRPSTARNDFELLAEIFKKVKAELKDRIEIYSVGENYNPSDYELDGIVNNLGIFSDMNKLAEIYRSADIGVAFISTPTFTYQHLEYMASGLCLVANAQSGVSDFLKDEENAILCPALPGLAAEKIIELINNPQKMEKISKAGIATVSDFTWDKCFSGICDYILKPKV